MLLKEKCRERLLLYLITDSALLKGRQPEHVVEEAIKGGVTMVQYREKAADYTKMREQGKRVQAVCKKYGVPFIVNDSVSLAKELDADGVHLGQEDGSLILARQELGQGKIIGSSAHNVEEALRAEAEGADYIGTGAVFVSATKENAAKLPEGMLRAVCRSVRIPVAAIGGINENNAGSLAGTGIAGIAVISAILAKEDIRRAAKGLRQICEKNFGK